MSKPTIELEPTEIKDCYVIKPTPFKDDRGELAKFYNVRALAEYGIDFVVREAFTTYNYMGTLRGLHFQYMYQQGKIIRCLSGKIQDVVVDLRENSPTFKKVVYQYLDCLGVSGPRRAILVPRGCAHGYLACSYSTIVEYLCDEIHVDGCDRGINAFSPELQIPWHSLTTKIIMSERDKALPTLDEYIADVRKTNEALKKKVKWL